MMRRPAPLPLFQGRLWRLELLLAFVQLFHLLLMSTAHFGDLVVWFFVHGIAQASLWVLRNTDREGPNFLIIPWRPLVVLFVVSLIFKLSSRAPIIGVWLADGLRVTRDSDELAGGSGLASYANIFFYPVAILLAFTALPRRVYRVLMICLFVMCAIDLIVLGTRNAPIFVLLFHLLAVPTRFGVRRVLTTLAFGIAFVAIFSYSTVNRTLEAAEGDFDWLVLFDSTTSTEVLKLNPATVEPLSRAVPAMIPAVFLEHYLSHSIAELDYLLTSPDRLKLGNASYLIDQGCAIGMCSREKSQDAILDANPRAGAYQTIWGSLLFDFGIVGALLAWVLGVGAVVLFKLIRLRASVLMVALASTVITLGMVENYLYNGLGLAQMLTIFIAYGLLRAFASVTRFDNRHGSHLRGTA
ncbi:MAG: hypothetical protein ABI645_00635 [Pseudomonadota bacterium]